MRSVQDSFFFKGHTRFRASRITMESILIFTGMVSHCLPLDLVRHLAFLRKIKIVLTGVKFDLVYTRPEIKRLSHCFTGACNLPHYYFWVSLLYLTFFLYFKSRPTINPSNLKKSKLFREYFLLLVFS